MTPEKLEAARVALIVMTFVAGMFSSAMLWLIKEPKTPRWMDFVTAVLLLLFAGLFLSSMGDIQAMFSADKGPELLLKNQYTVALLVVPFFTAGLATNILANLVLSERDYKGTHSFADVAINLVKPLLFAASMLTVIPFVLYAVYVWTKKKSSA